MQTVKTFSQVTKENLKHYVYCLVDSRDNSVFYVGRGQGNRVFDHVNDAIKTQTSSPKLDRIREIVKRGGHVLHYIIRHNLTVDEAKIVESTLIDVFTYSVFFQKWALTNLVAGYHQWYEGIKTVDEIELLYNCRKLQPKDHDKLLLVCLNTSYKKNVNLYDITRQAWPIADSKAECVDYVLGVYKGIVRCVIKPDKYTILPKQGKKNERNRVVFEGDYENNDRISDYLNTDATAYPFGLRQSVKYIGFGANTNKKSAKKPNIMYFDSDAEFEDFCVAPFATVKETKSGVPYIGGNYSDEYLKCLKSGVRFIIRDTESAIYERQCVCKRVPVIHNGKPLGHDYLVQLNVENLEPYQ